MKRAILIIFIIISISNGQSWQRSKPIEQKIELFHSNYALVMPSAEIQSNGNILFEVSHRFIPAILGNENNFLGLDGPVNIRLALGYGISDKMMVNLLKSNVMDNVEFQFRNKLKTIKNKTFPIIISNQIGIAYNGETYDPVENDFRKWQFYDQVVVNTLINNKLGIGLVPSYLYNSSIYCTDNQYTLSIGSYLQYYITNSFSLIMEYTPTISGWRKDYNSGGFAIEIETGGHFFKLCLTNNTKMNLSQYLAGASTDLSKINDWHLGFYISRTF